MLLGYDEAFDEKAFYVVIITDNYIKSCEDLEIFMFMTTLEEDKEHVRVSSRFESRNLR